MLLMLERAKNDAVDVITLDSSLTAHQFYLSFGFVDTDSCQKHMIGGYPVSCIPMKYVFLR